MKSPFAPLLAFLVFTCMASLLMAEDEKEEEQPAVDPKEYRTFTAKNGKSLQARVITRIDDERYTVETPDGKKFTLKIDSLSDSDRRYLEFWEPDAILDLKSASLDEVLGQMSYDALDLTTSEGSFFVTATVDGKEGKFILDPSRNFSTLDPAAASAAGLELREGRINFSDANGKVTRSKQGTVKSFQAGETEVTSHVFEVIEVAKVFRNIPANTIGAIGGDLLKELNALVDHAGKRLFVKGEE